MEGSLQPLISYTHFERQIKLCNSVTALTGLQTFAQLIHEGEWVLHDIQDGQQGACEAQKFTEAIKTKVNQISC